MYLRTGFRSPLLLLFTAVLLGLPDKLWPAALLSLLCWTGLGCLAIGGAGGAHFAHGHPSPELLQRLQGRTLHTDQSGAVQLVTGGHSLCVNYFLAGPEEVAASGNVHAPDHQ
jgi:hypothetical protein